MCPEGEEENENHYPRKIERLLNWDKAEKIIEKNIMELLTSKNKKVRMAAAKVFAEFIKPKKREKAHSLKQNIV